MLINNVMLLCNLYKILEILYGIASSTEVAYYTYIYAKVYKFKIVC